MYAALICAGIVISGELFFGKLTLFPVMPENFPSLINLAETGDKHDSWGLASGYFGHHL